MKSLILFILFSSLIIATATAQNTDREVYPKQVSIDHNEAVQKFSRDFVSAFSEGISPGNFQQIISEINRFSGINMTGNNNLAFLIQQGYGNAGIINIWGDKNEARLQQKGNDLFSILNIFGNFNRVALQQQGVDLNSYLKLFGSGMKVEALQTNTGMRLIQTGEGAIPLRIRTGPATPIIIRNNY